MMTSSGFPTLYYLPGYGGSLNAGLGAGLLSRGFHVTGRETREDFRNLPFSSQVQTIVDDLQTHFWRRESRVVCNSFGAFLFLHAQSRMPSFIGKVLLLSPIVGEFENNQTQTGFSPPQPSRLFELAKSGVFPAPPQCEIHVGSEDWQSQPDIVEEFGRLTGIPVYVVTGRGHDLGKEHVDPILDKWLAN